MIDLHVHTTVSDGELDPKDVVRRAKEKGVSAIAIADHDAVDGLDEAIEEGKKIGVEVIPAIELNAKVEKGKMHILGYYMNYKDVDFANKMNLLRKDREDRNEEFIKEFNKQNINITIEQVKKYAVGNVIAKPHFARALLENGYINDIEEAYSNYFNVPPLKNIQRKSITPKEAIKLIKDAGGIAVIAHPITLKLNDEELDDKIKKLKTYGLDGMECYNNIHTPEDVTKLKKIARENNMLITAGSDFHGPISTPGVEIGSGKNGNIISDIPDMLENLKKLRK